MEVIDNKTKEQLDSIPANELAVYINKRIKRFMKESTPSQKKRKWKYRKSDELGDSCGLCNSFVRITYNDKTYFKCSLIGMSNSSATDIARSGICDKFNRG